MLNQHVRDLLLIKIAWIIYVIAKSTIHTNEVISKHDTITTIVESLSCCLVGQETFFISLDTSVVYSFILAIIFFFTLKS